MPTLFYSNLCPDCPPFQATLTERGIAYEAVNITESMKNLKRFLAIRDHASAFDDGKSKGYVCIPCLVYEDGRIIFETKDL